MRRINLGNQMSNSVKKIPIGAIRSDKKGFSNLAELAVELKPYSFDTIQVDFSGCEWFDANMSAALGVIFAHTVDRFNTIELIGLPEKIKNILMRNHFLTEFGWPVQKDAYGTIVPYQRFSINNEVRYFVSYLNSHYIGKDIPDMSNALSECFKKSILEIFVNATMHSESELGVFACGQYFPKKQRLDLCIADAGIGIRRKIYKECGLRMNSDEAIQWALQEGNTTRKGNIPGGLGLKLIQEFVKINKGRIQIVSDRGYWEFDLSGEIITRMDKAFPGTVINIEIDTADTNSYYLRSEAK
jgi:hypothetical protein